MDATSLAMVILGAQDSVNGCRQKLCYGVAWRQRKLLVAGKIQQAGDRPIRGFSRVESERDRLCQCLLRSSVKLVLLDPGLAASDLQLWAELGQRSHKPVYLRLRSMPSLPERVKPVAWVLKGGCDRLVAFLLLAVLSPLFLAAALMIGLTTPGDIFSRQWHVGKRGRLFKLLTFRCSEDAPEPESDQVGLDQVGLDQAGPDRVHALDNTSKLSAIEHNQPLTSTGSWLRRYGVDRWPQLINVLLGEISLVGPQAQSLATVSQILPAQHRCLNVMPGITGAWMAVPSAQTPDNWSGLATPDLLYTAPWSLRRDFSDLVRTIPKAFQRNLLP